MAVISFDEEDGTGVRGIGDALRKERVRRGMTIAQAAQEAGLPGPVVQGLEQGALAVDDVKTSAYLRMYARALGLDAETRVRDLTGEKLVPGDRAQADAAGGGPWGGPSPARARWTRGRPRGLWLALLFVVVVVVAAAATAGVLTVLRDSGVVLVSPGSGTDDGDAVSPGTRPEPPGAETTPTPTPTPTPSPEPEPEPEPEPAGRAPADTRVQVLHHPDQAEAVDEVVAVLEDLGYQVVLVSTARTAFPATTVLYSDGWEEEAAALGVRDDRFAEVDVNDRFSEEIDLHVGIGPEWAATPEEQE